MVVVGLICSSFHHVPRTSLAGEGGLRNLVHVLELFGGQPLTV